MNSETCLLRQIHRNHLQANSVASSAFRPTPKDTSWDIDMAEEKE